MDVRALDEPFELRALNKILESRRFISISAGESDTESYE